MQCNAQGTLCNINSFKVIMNNKYIYERAMHNNIVKFSIASYEQSRNSAYLIINLYAIEWNLVPVGISKVIKVWRSPLPQQEYIHIIYFM